MFRPLGWLFGIWIAIPATFFSIICKLWLVFWTKICTFFGESYRSLNNIIDDLFEGAKDIVSKVPFLDDCKEMFIFIMPVTFVILLSIVFIITKIMTYTVNFLEIYLGK